VARSHSELFPPSIACLRHCVVICILFHCRGNSAVIARVRSKLAISTGSACSSGVEAPSHVLQALKLSEEVVEGALRIGLGKFTTDDDVLQAAEILTQAIGEVVAHCSGNLGKQFSSAL
ncbi:MAG: hypothetical protein MUF49_06820, partial [Oculatellaceae cyanobacterium Prado106]|nr:hypothetical protein [Oculatellaceae cyanobacterium Prado106]